MKTKSVLIVLLLVISLIFTSCFEENAVYKSIIINLNDFADAMGDCDGAASTEEIEAVNEYFLNNSLAYFMIGSLNIYDPPISGSEFANRFHIMSLSEIYSSENQMREAFEGVGIKTPWVAISLAILIDGDITITHIYRAPGPNVYEGAWERVEVE